MHSTFKFKNLFTTTLIIVFIFSTMIGYLPEIYDNKILYSQFRTTNIAVLAIIFLALVNLKTLLKNSFLKSILLQIIIFFTILLILETFNYNASTIAIIPILTAYIGLYIGYRINISKKNLLIILFFYSVFAIYLGYQSAKSYLGDLSLETDLYLLQGKNQIGVFVSAAAFFMLTFIFLVKGKYRKLFITIFCILLFLNFIIRCRTALVGFFIASIIFLWKATNNRKKLIYLSIILFLTILLENQISELINNTFILDRNIDNLNELSSGRFKRNDAAIQYIYDNLFIGELISSSRIDMIHNYILKNLVQFGIWCFPLIICYILFISKTAKSIIEIKQINIYNIGYFATIIPFFCSLLEPDAPFGPGSAMSFFFILFGISQQKSLMK